MKLVVWLESTLIVLMLLLGWAFVANHNISLKSHLTPDTQVYAICDATTLIWSDFNPSTGYGANHIDANSPSCGG